MPSLFFMVDKLLSARFWISIIVTVTGCYIAIKQGSIPEQFATIWGVVVYAYFNRVRTEKDQRTYITNSSSDR